MTVSIAKAQTESVPATSQEIDLNTFLSEVDLSPDELQKIITVKCTQCGAESTLRPNLAADACPFCATPLVLQNQHTQTVVKPKHLLPFRVTVEDAANAFRRWLSKLWFAPNSLQQSAHRAEPLAGVYIPYWTYDAQTVSHYTGERGTDYQEQYSVQVNGRSETRTRTKTRWSRVSGVVQENFDDVLVLASKSLPEKQTRALEPWDLTDLTAWDERYLVGFRAETYQVGIKDGFENAQAQMSEIIRHSIRRDIGGDHQRIHDVDTLYDQVTFKHILLPIWVSAFRHVDKVYRFVVNARTGEVQGERPYSWVKISLAVAAGLLILGFFAWATEQQP